MSQRTTVLICLACLVMALKAGADESPDGIATMRMQLECGWLEQLSSDADSALGEAAVHHVITGAELAVDPRLERQ